MKMFPVLFLVFLTVTSTLGQELEVRGQRSPRDTAKDSIKVVISESCATQGDASDGTKEGTELDLSPGSPLVLTHKIRLVPSGSGSGSCGCDLDLAALKERIERLEREVSDLREKCGDPESPGCCGSKESKGPGCSIKPDPSQCPNDCNDQGRCVDGKCVCYPEFSGSDCSESECPGNCNDRGRCVNGQCECDPGYTGPDCSQNACPDNCNNKGKCVNGKCVCDAGFSGENCAEKTCPGNCNNRGRCVDGKCVCDVGFSGLDCATKTCPDNCNNKGRCVNGKCVCNAGFGGENCNEKTCPGNCNKNGRCVNGQCVCDSGFKGLDCSEKACPNDCSANGKCVDGKCVCEAGFTGPDCSAKGCPGNCNSRGRCVRGKCICKKGFTGPDCGQCQEGLTGPNCDMVMSGVEQLSTKDLTESSVTVVWTLPLVQYESYLISFTSQKEGESVISAEVDGSQTSFTQTGLASGQTYTVTVTGKTGDRRGAERSTDFSTLLSGPSNLRVVKTTTSTAVVQWEPALSEIDRYRLTVTPSNDRAGRKQELTFDSSTSSAHITQLEAGLMYEVTLVAEKGRSKSEPVTTQATPGTPNTLTAALTLSPTIERKEDQPNLPQSIISKQTNIPRLTKVTRKINVTYPRKTLVGENTDKTQPGTQFSGENYHTVGSGINSGDIEESGPKEADTGTDLTTLKPKRACLKRIIVTHGRVSLKDNSDGCGESGKNDTPKVEGLIESGEQNIQLSGRNLQNSEIATRDDEPLHRLLKDTFRNLNVTTFAIHLVEPSNITANAEIVTRQILQGLKPLTSIAKSPYSYKPPFSPIISENSQITTASPTSATEVLAVTNSIVGETVDDKIVQTSNDSNIENEKPELRKEGDVPMYRRTQPNRTFIRRFRPNSGQFRNRTILSSRLNHSSSLLSPNKMNTTSTERAMLATEKSSLSDKNVINANNNQSSEESGQPTNEGVVPIRRVPLNTRFERQNITNFAQNKSHPNYRSFRRPARLLNNKTETQNSKVETTPLVPLPVLAYLENNDDKANVPLTRPYNLTRPSFNRSRVVLPRRPNAYIGSFHNRTRLGPLNRGPLQKNWTPSTMGQWESQNNSAIEDGKIDSQIFIQGIRSPESNQEKSPSGSGNIDSRNIGEAIRDGQDVSNSNEKNIHSQDAEVKHGTDVPRSQLGADDQNILVNGHFNLGEERVIVPSSQIQRQIQKHDSDSEPTSDIRLDISSSIGEPGAQESTRESGLQNGFITGDSEGLGVLKSSQGIKIETHRDHPSRRMGENDRKMPKHNQEIVEVRGPGNIGDDGGDWTSEGTNKQIVDRNNDQNVLVESSGTEDWNDQKIQDNDSKKQTKMASLVPSPQPTRSTNQFVEDGASTRSSNILEDKSIGVTKHQANPDGKLDSTVFRRPGSNPRVVTPRRRISWQNYGRNGTRFGHGFRINATRNLNRVHLQMRPDYPKNGVNLNGGEFEPENISVTNKTADKLTVEHDVLESKKIVATGKDIEKENALIERNGIQNGTPQINENSQDPGESPELSLEDLLPKTDYKVTVLGKGPGVLSRLHKLVISTGPEPPSDLVFSHVTEDSVTVSWTKPKSQVSGFKVTYTHSEDGEPVSVSLDSGNSSVGLYHLTPGSTYEVSVLSVLGLDESDPISKTLKTLPDPPTDLKAVNISDSGALLLWRPALAAVDKYTIVYGSGTGSELRVTVSGNTVEQQLNNLEPSTTYSVTISSQLEERESREASTRFTTTGDGPRDLKATNVTPRTATLSWKPPSGHVIGYRLTYQTEGQTKEVVVGATVTQFNLTRLFPGSEYRVELNMVAGEVLSTKFTTGSLQFPFPTDCSQELLNGILISGLVDIFPQGKKGDFMTVWCDMETDGGGWTVFQRRKDGSEDFFQGWKEYVQGFGDPSGEFWLGLDPLHTLTTATKMTLRVDLRDGNDAVFAKYSTFEVAKRNYRLSVGGYSGTAGDSMTYHNNRIFTTKDRDPASFITRCAMSYRGGWWYKNCHEANLNGLFGIDVKHQGIIWTSWRGKDHSIPFTEMKMRPTAFIPHSNNYNRG